MTLSTVSALPKRLIEVDLPIKRISAHARREKSIRHGHISTLHIWWARRPLAACRAVVCAALWPDPADPLCPQPFRDAAARVVGDFARRVCGQGKVLTPGLANGCSEEGLARWRVLARPDGALDANDDAHRNVLRFALLDFIADFANWDNATVPEYLEAARALTQAAHEALGGEPGTRPLVVDPFAGGGSIPLEALRVGADAFASDLNPVAVLLNKVVLEYIPKYGRRLADEVRTWGRWIKEQAEKELAPFYPKDADGATPIAYLWARTIKCEGPGCGAEVPLMRSLWLARRAGRVNALSVALRLVPNRAAKRADFEIVENAQAKDVGGGTVKRGSATCPCCGFTTPVASVRRQLKERRGGAADARLFCVVTTRPGRQGRFYRLPTERDLEAVRQAAAELERRTSAPLSVPRPSVPRSAWDRTEATLRVAASPSGGRDAERPDVRSHAERGTERAEGAARSLVPEEPTPRGGGTGAGRAFSQRHYGMERWGDLFTPRQLLALTTLARLVRQAGEQVCTHDASFGRALQFALALIPGKQADLANSLCAWEPMAQCPRHLFGRQAIPIVWDFAEGVPIGASSGAWEVFVNNIMHTLTANGSDWLVGEVQQANATRHPLLEGMAQVLFTDPPYYDAVPYSDLSDFFYVWLRRVLPDFGGHQECAPKREECIVDEVKGKDHAFFERTMQEAMREGHRILAPTGVGIVVFAHKTTSGWEAQLQGMVNAGWTITASWPVDTECGSRLRAMDSAALASSVHLVCRPRSTEEIGDWRDVLTELPRRIHDWMPRLSSEGIVGADAIFACLGPALEIFSRYCRVEKASGEVVSLRDYLEHVWAAVSKEALSMIFAGADATGFDADARLTAMWFWTLSAGANGAADGEAEADEEGGSEEEESPQPAKSGGYVLEYDAARKIAQGLGAHLEQLASVVEVTGDKARLRPVSERTRFLFGKEETTAAPRNKQVRQRTLFDPVGGDGGQEEGGWGELPPPQAGATVLDRLHQGMILFAAGRGPALQRFLVEDGVGRDTRFWKLAQALSALYPAGSEEKRWVDGVLARKKGLGF